MDRFEARRAVEQAFARNSKSDLQQVLKLNDIPAMIDVLWDYMTEADSSLVAKRELQERIWALEDKSGQRTRCICVLPNRRAFFAQLREEIMRRLYMADIRGRKVPRI